MNSYLDNIREKIKNSSCLSSNLQAFSCSSTTDVPASISALVQQYFANVKNNLSKVSELTNAIANIHEEYIRTDKKLKEGADIIKGD